MDSNRYIDESIWNTESSLSEHANISSNETPNEQAQLGSEGPALPDPLTYNLAVASMQVLGAVLRNATWLAFDIPCRSLVSPLFRPVGPQQDPDALLASALIPTVPQHLQPTLPQIMYPHPPYIDTLPFPTLRERAIIMSALAPHTFDLADLKKDIFANGGLVCCGNTTYSQPWDMRSWEARPWFLMKWRMLVGGEEGEIWKQSRWWLTVSS